jgi:hypothetical protein
MLIATEALLHDHVTRFFILFHNESFQLLNLIMHLRQLIYVGALIKANALQPHRNFFVPFQHTLHSGALASGRLIHTRLKSYGPSIMFRQP